MMLFIIGLPVVQIILFCLSIGKDPVGLRLAIVNNELNSSMEECIPTIGCNLTLLSCRFLQHLEKRKVVYIPYETDEEAIHAVEKGWAWGTINFPGNYSASLMERIDYGKDADEFSIMYADMHVTMDMSSKRCCNDIIRDCGNVDVNEVRMDLQISRSDNCCSEISTTHSRSSRRTSPSLATTAINCLTYLYR